MILVLNYPILRIFSKRRLRSPVILFRLILLLALIAILLYLNIINSTSEVYIDVEASEIGFVVADQNLTELIDSILVIDWIQLFNCSLEALPERILDANGATMKTESGSMGITRSSAGYDSQLILQNAKEPYLHLKSLHTPSGSDISISREGSSVTMALKLEDRSDDFGDTVYGTIGVGKRFSLSGKNIKLAGLGAYSDYDLLSIITSERFQNVSFQGNDNVVMLQFHFPTKQTEDSIVLLDNLLVRNISFAFTDKTKEKDRVNSTIKSGKIQIGGVDLSGKRFLIKEEELEESDFLDIPNDEEYFIDFVKMDGENLKVSLFKENANGLKKGKRSRLVRSIFPSKLDFAVKEPSGKTIWMILVFIFAQIVPFFQRYFRRETTNQESDT